MIIYGDALSALKTLSSDSFQVCVTSPPYWGLRDYGVSGQLGLEDTPSQYVENLTKVFREVRRVITPEGCLWLNLGDTYAGYHGNRRVLDHLAPSNKPGYVENMRKSTVGVDRLKPKDLCGIPWRVAAALRDDGWYLRADVIWVKPRPRRERTFERPRPQHEYIFMFSKSKRCRCDTRRIDTLGTVWRMDTVRPSQRNHPAPFPDELPRRCILVSTERGDSVLDPFLGSGTTARVAEGLGRNYVGIEINPQFSPKRKDRDE